jgi:hypothetical protein
VGGVIIYQGGSMKYEIVESNVGIEDLEKQVKTMIGLNWEPLGGVSVAISESDEYRYYSAAQAMIKKD